VIASRLAVEGLDVEDGVHVALAETDEQFVATILRLLDEPACRAALATRARAWGCANLDWERSLVAYEALYEQLIGASKRVAVTT
jgi:hypothetical protein